MWKKCQWITLIITNITSHIYMSNEHCPLMTFIKGFIFLTIYVDIFHVGTLKMAYRVRHDFFIHSFWGCSSIIELITTVASKCFKENNFPFALYASLTLYIHSQSIALFRLYFLFLLHRSTESYANV